MGMVLPISVVGNWDFGTTREIVHQTMVVAEKFFLLCLVELDALSMCRVGLASHTSETLDGLAVPVLHVVVLWCLGLTETRGVSEKSWIRWFALVRSLAERCC